MKYKILLFLCILLLTGTICSAVDNSTNLSDRVSTHLQDKQTDTTPDTSVIRKEKNNHYTKEAAAKSVEVYDSYGETYYGSRISYTATTNDENMVDEGLVELYVNNTLIATQTADSSGDFDWMYNNQYNEILDTYPRGEYPVKVIYKNNGESITSNTAHLYLDSGASQITMAGYITVTASNIIVPVTALSYFDENPLNHGSITASYNGNNITSIACNASSTYYLELPGRYQQKTVLFTYSDNNTYLKDSSIEVFLDVIVPGNGKISTTLTVNDAHFINTTHMDGGELIFDSIDILVLVDVTGDNEKISMGQLNAYHNNTLIATSNNATSIIIPGKYNLEEITLTYTGVDDYNNTSNTFTIVCDKISTRTYISRVSASQNSVVNIYPTVTSNIAFIYGKIHIFIDSNLVKTIDIDEDGVYVSVNGTRTTIGSNLDLSGFDDGQYTLTVEVEDNNVFTSSEYTNTLTINKVNTYIYAYNRTIYVGDTTNLYAYVYANNRQTINTGQMSFTIDGELIGMEDVHNNTASIEYPIPSTLALGKHTLHVDYTGDDSFNTSSKEVTLTLAKTSTTTTLRTWTVSDEKIVLNATTRAYNKTIDTGNIEAYTNNNKVATSNVVNNTAIITLPGTVTTDNTYQLKLVYAGTEYYNTSTYEVTGFVFNKKNTTTRLYPYLKSNGTLTLTSYIYSDNYAKVNTGEVIFYINSKQVATASVQDNKASTTYDMTGYDAGNYTIKATYNGSLLFRTSNNSSSVTKTPYYHTTYMTLLNKTLTVKRGASTDINATLTCYTRNITEDIQATIRLNATWGSEVYSEDVVFHNGVLNHKFTLPSDFQLFTFYGQEITKYTLTITTQQSKNFKSTSQTGTIQVGEYTKLYQKALWAYKNNNVTFNTTLQDKDGKQVNTNTTARIDIYTTSSKGHDLIKTFNTNITNGKLTYTYKLPSTMTNNTYLVNITALSNKNYAGSYKTVNLTLNNRRTYISTTNIIGYVGKTVVLNGSITDSLTKTKVNTNAKVTISMDGKTVATVNVTKGVFRYTLNNNLTEGKHQLSYTYNGDTIYNTSTRTVNFTSNRNTLRLTLGTLTGSIGDTVKITATVINTSGAIVKDNLKAQILLNGKQIANNIDVTGGKLNYNYIIPAGTTSSNKITVIIQETSTYKTRNATTTLKVNKAYQYINMATTTITTTSGSKIYITGNITDKNKNLIANSKVNLKIAGREITNITTTNGKFNYEYTVTQSKGTYDILLTATATNNYYYNAKHMSLKVTG